jgi:hypothetical protein
MLLQPENKNPQKFANIDMDKFKFDFRLFVPEEGTDAKFEAIDKEIK